MAKGIDPKGKAHPKGGGMPAFNPAGGTTRTPNKPKPGSNPKASMVDGPYGGKKPQSGR